MNEPLPSIEVNGRKILLWDQRLAVPKSQRGVRPEGWWALDSDDATYSEAFETYLRLVDLWKPRFNRGRPPSEEQRFALMISVLAHFAHEQQGDFRLVFVVPPEPASVFTIYRRLKSHVIEEKVVRYRPQKKRHLSVKGL